MGLFSRFTKRRRIVTEAELAKSLAQTAAKLGFSGENSIYEIVAAQKELSERPNQIEILIVAAFPLDVLAVTHFPDRAESVRSAFRRELTEICKLMVLPEYQRTIVWGALPSLIDNRLLEYAELMRASDDSEGLRRYSFKASERIVGGVQLPLVMHIGVQFSLVLRHMADDMEQIDLR